LIEEAAIVTVIVLRNNRFSICLYINAAKSVFSPHSARGLVWQQYQVTVYNWGDYECLVHH